MIGSVPLLFVFVYLVLSCGRWSRVFFVAAAISLFPRRTPHPRDEVDSTSETAPPAPALARAVVVNKLKMTFIRAFRVH